MRLSVIMCECVSHLLWSLWTRHRLRLRIANVERPRTFNSRERRRRLRTAAAGARPRLRGPRASGQRGTADRHFAYGVFIDEHH